MDDIHVILSLGSPTLRCPAWISQADFTGSGATQNCMEKNAIVTVIDSKLILCSLFKHVYLSHLNIPVNSIIGKASRVFIHIAHWIALFTIIVDFLNLNCV